MHAITRRTALAVPVTLPLLPLASSTQPAESGPAVAAFGVWRAALGAYERSWDRPHVADDDSIMNAAMNEEWQAKIRLAGMVATTPAGLAGQLRMGLGMFGEMHLLDGDWDNPADYTFERCGDDLDGRLYRNMLVAAEAMAEGGA